MAKRLKVEAFKTRSEFDAGLDDAAALQLELEELQVQRDQKVQAVLDEYNADIQSLENMIKVKVSQAEKYAKAHKIEILEDGKKSGETPLCRFGFRTGNKTLVLLNREWSWEKVVNALKGTQLAKYIVKKETVDKDGLKAKLSAESLEAIGCKIKQKEDFWVEPKREDGGRIE